MDEGAIFSIGAVARMTGVPASTLRTWEDRYGLVVASRSAGGQRRYTREQLERLLFVVRRVRDGLSPGDAHRLLAEGGTVADTGDPDVRGPRALVVERDPHAAEHIEHVLRAEGHRVEVVADPAAAGRRAQADGPDLVVMDLLASGGVGGPLVEGLRRSNARVVVVSPLAAEEISAAVGADAFLRKPIDPTALVVTVRRLLGATPAPRGRLPSPA